MKHTQESPFPVKTALGKVIDERCMCGALRSEHMDTFSFGHGPCPATQCEKFTWAEFVLADD